MINELQLKQNLERLTDPETAALFVRKVKEAERWQSVSQKFVNLPPSQQNYILDAFIQNHTPDRGRFIVELFDFIESVSQALNHIDFSKLPGEAFINFENGLHWFIGQNRMSYPLYPYVEDQLKDLVVTLQFYSRILKELSERVNKHKITVAAINLLVEQWGPVAEQSFNILMRHTEKRCKDVPTPGSLFGAENESDRIECHQWLLGKQLSKIKILDSDQQLAWILDGKLDWLPHNVRRQQINERARENAKKRNPELRLISLSEENEGWDKSNLRLSSAEDQNRDWELTKEKLIRIEAEFGNTRMRIIRARCEDPEASIPQIAATVRLNPDTVDYHLNVLRRKENQDRLKSILWG